MSRTSRHRSSTAVGFLTATRSLRRRSATNPAFAVLALLGMYVCNTGSAAETGNWHPIAEIKRVAEDYVLQRTRNSDAKVKPSAGYLDPRLRLPRCDVGLEAFQRDDASISRRTIVGVRCTGNRPWKVYIPIDVAVNQTVLVSRRTLPRGHKLAAGDLQTEQRDVSRLSGGYFVEHEAVIGQRLKQRIMAGRVIAPALLAADTIIRRGQSVTLIVQNDRLNIRMAGRAMMDGAVNQRIRVENLTSQRVVEGLVRSPEYVEVLVQ